MKVRGFIKLLERYRNETLPVSVKEVIEVWYSTIKNEPIERNVKSEIKERMWSGIRENLLAENKAKETQLIWYRLVSMGKVAAVVIVFLTGLFWASNTWFFDKSVHHENGSDLNGDWTQESNEGKSVKIIQLSDGSKVTLDPGSKLSFPKKFQPTERKVYLTGSGFFDVTKNQERPFLVYSGNVLTRVLGTSFMVKFIPKTGRTEVSVVSGKVTVEKLKSEDGDQKSKGSENRVVLTPNKKVTFFKDSDHYITGLVDNPILLVDDRGPDFFNFDDTPLSIVIETLENSYGVEITLGNESVLDCPITADLSSDNLYEKLEIIAAILNAQYEITGSSILFTGGRCISTISKH